MQISTHSPFCLPNPSLSMVVTLQRYRISPGIPTSPGSFVLYQKIISCKSGKWWVVWGGAGGWWGWNSWISAFLLLFPALSITQFVALLESQRGSEIPFNFSNGFQILTRCFVFKKKTKTWKCWCRRKFFPSVFEWKLFMRTKDEIEVFVLLS